MTPDIGSSSAGIVALIGGGGRESALAWKLAQSPAVQRVLLVPGNGYTATANQVDKVSNATFSLSLEDPVNFTAFAEWCEIAAVSLVVVGPEAPLAVGLADFLNARGIGCFGPTRDAARLEWDKAYAKKFFDAEGIPTAQWRAFTDATDAEAFIKSASFEPLVVKATGLAAGKGVVVAKDREEACEAVRNSLNHKKFGDAGSVIVVEEKLVGPEVSVLCFTDGFTVVAMPAAQDAKRIGEGDTGPNTGGMGAYVPVHSSILSEEDYRTVVGWVEKTVKALQREECRYVGILYAGVMLTKDGPRMLEYNCRFGDPETEALLPLLEGDLYEILQSCVHKTLDKVPVKFAKKASVCVVLASEGYPISSAPNRPIQLPKEVKNFQLNESTFLFPAAVAKSGDSLTTSGGRVAMVVGVADGLLQASLLAQRAAERIQFVGKQKRSDIGYQSILRTVTQAGLTYKACDVDIDEGDRLVSEFIVPEAKQTGRVGLLEGVGGFGGLFDLTPLNYKEAVLVSGTDGVGTKLLIAEEIGKHETIGIDLVAMSVNDILTHNAEPLVFLDYFATGKLEADVAGLVLKGIAAGCVSSNCTLIGGETAEMPGMYPPGRYDLAGFAVGVAEKSQLLPRVDTIAVGDVVLGISSSGIHSNGYSLVRKVVELSGQSYDAPAPFNIANSLGDELLTPTKIYVKSLLPALRTGRVKAAAHITGGGLTENIPRILPKNMDVILNAQAWPVLPVFSWLSMEGRVDAREMARTFNMGIGMVLIVSPDSVDVVQSKIAENGEIALAIGTVVEGKRETRIEGLESSLLSSYMSWAVCLSDLPLKTTARPKRKVGILLSGTGTNMEALVAYTRDPLNRSAAEVVVVVSNIPDAIGVAKAKALGIPVEIVDHKQFIETVDGKSACDRSKYDKQINDTLERHGVEVVCLAGYMRICTSVFVEKWRGRCINTHPAILPAFKGKDAVQMALDAKVRVTGCTVHFVEEEVDAGGIILQQAVNVFPDDTKSTLHERIKAVEHTLFPKAMEAVCRGDAVRVASDPTSGSVGAVCWSDKFKRYMPDNV
ncbi:Trifunctional purine biosynthetic protein adenosine-3 [Hypsibius exemplaris]|uniref:Trifunctional purine biosynthetic protein adenosine-3 n=1 Tax=Hypsibius exemplaris TaxID=2072580 RepID=A0A1W0X2D4_HYPEX|nr:Trifunctional purine biosynthetic protein adenosine-3 [Hypsibius exemplaris]